MNRIQLQPHTSTENILVLWLEWLTESLMHESHFSYACKMRYPLNLVLDNSEYLWFY